MYSFLKLYGSYTFTLFILYFDIIKILTVKEGPLDSYCISLRMVFGLTCLRMVLVQAETCSVHVNVTVRIEINLCCIRLNKCGLY
jgi:hypothetical protein